MDRILTLLLAVGFGLAFLLSLRGVLKSARQRRVARVGFFDLCQALLSDVRTGAGTAGFQRVGGKFQGVEVDLQAVPDTLTFRKLPALWVLVTLPGPLPLRATLDVMVRPTGLEPFSNFGRLPEQIALPPGFPATATIRTDDAGALPPAAVITPHLGLFDDPRIKELVLSPRGLRLVFLAEEADRTRYLLYRDAEMGADPLPAAQLEPLLQALVGLRRDIIQALPEKEPA